MKHKIIVFGISALIQINGAHAISFIKDTCPSVTCPADSSTNPNAIAQVATQCLYADSVACFQAPSGTIYSINICSSCVAGTLTTTSVGDLIGGECSGGSFMIQTCCNTCTNCTSDTTYTAYGTGYESKATRSCNCGGCNVTSISYRCAAGYYGSSVNGTTGCTKCPDGGTSIAGSNASITSCYLPTGTKFSDTGGGGEYSEDCYYTG